VTNRTELDDPVLAAIDIGTNSVHLVVARAIAADRFEILAREKDMVRLGSGGGEMKRLADDAVDRAVAALARHRAIAEAHGAPVRAVATSAVREAENRHVFLRRSTVEAGVRVEVISGFEEARLIHLGVLQALPIYDRRVLVVDIGGGSTEVVLGERDEAIVARSLKLGAIRLTDRFFADAAVKKSAVTKCRRHVRSVIAPLEREIDRFDLAVASSGTAMSVATMALAARGTEPVQTLNQVVISAEEVSAVVDALIAAPTVRERRRIPGLDPTRADIIVAGAIVLDEVLTAFGATEVMLSTSSLREGVLADTYRRTHGGSLHHLRDIRRRGVLHLADLTDDDPEHSAQSAHLALQLFDQLAPWHGLDDRHREYLEAAALLSNVGLFISHAGHHKHSYYVIRNSEHLTGFTDNEVEVIAQVARYHRKSAPKAKHDAFAALEESDQDVVRTLAGLLRVAIGLDRAHRGSVGAIQCSASDVGLLIEIEPASGADTSVEIWSADERKGLLEEVLGCPIDVVSEG
jgi:exopolyphosphatase / guanosine-5'-triphosphate,3'-diphosphate pyrophosphatase